MVYYVLWRTFASERRAGVSLVNRHEELMDLLREVNKGVFELVNEALKEYRLGMTSMMIMRQLHGQPGCSVSKLSRLTGLAKSHVSKTVDSLSEQGFIDKREDESDQRLVRLYPADKAEEKFQEIHAAVRRHLAVTFADLQSDAVEGLINGLQAMKSILDLHQ